MVRMLLLVAHVSVSLAFMGVGKRYASLAVSKCEVNEELKSECSRRKGCFKRHMSQGGKGGDSVNTENPYYVGMSAYEILGVKKEVDKKAVKSAYRKLVSMWHPDKFPDDESKKKEGGLRMERINRAYFCLEDDDRRRRYDLYGEKAVGTSASSEEKMKNNADAYFGGDSNGKSSSSSDSGSDSGGGRKYSSGGQREAYRVEDDPFVWDKFRREQEDKRRKYDEDKRSRDSEYNPEPQRQKSDDNSGQDWSDDWWKAGGGSSGDGPRRPAYGSGSYSDDEVDYDDYDTDQGSVPFPNADSSYEDIMDFLQKTGGFGVPDTPGGDYGGGGGGGDFATKRIYDDDSTIDSPQLRILRGKKGTLLQEQGGIRRRLGDDSTDWGEVTDANAIAQRLSDMNRVQTIDQEIGELDDEIEDAVMRIKMGEMPGGGDGFSQRAWGSAVGADDSVNPLWGSSSSSSSGGSGSSTGSSNDLWGFGDEDAPRRPRGVTARRRTGSSARAGNVYGRSPPSREPPRTPPPVSNKDGGGDGDDGDRKRPTMTSQGRVAKEENAVRQRRRPAAGSRAPAPPAGAGAGAGTSRSGRRDLYAEQPDFETDADGHDSTLGGSDGDGTGGEDMREAREEEGSSGSWRRSYAKRRQGKEDAGTDDGKTPDQRFLEEIERLQREGPTGPRSPRR